MGQALHFIFHAVFDYLLSRAVLFRSDAVAFYLLPLFLTFTHLFYNFGFDLNFVDHLDRRRIENCYPFGYFLRFRSHFVAIGSRFDYRFFRFCGCVFNWFSAFDYFCNTALVTKDIHPQINFTAANIINRFWQKKMPA